MGCLNHSQHWPLPAKARPIVLFGAGSVVTDAHLPAYRDAALPVVGIYDIDQAKAERAAKLWDIPHVYASGEEAASEPNAVFDLALPPQAHIAVLSQLSHGAGVLLQKPMGRDLPEASAILETARKRGLIAAVNFQLRFAPLMLALKAELDSGRLGTLTDIEVHVNVLTPWGHFPFVQSSDRIELSLHSIHYLDAIRFLAGEPRGVHALSLPFPGSNLSATRTTAILDYGAQLRCALSINHHHAYDKTFQEARLKIEGDRGAAVLNFGGLVDYPRGEPDSLWINVGAGWQSVPLEGNWFPHAFKGPMCNLQRVLGGEDRALISPLTDAWRTMAVVEACEASSQSPTTPIAERS